MVSFNYNFKFRISPSKSIFRFFLFLNVHYHHKLNILFFSGKFIENQRNQSDIRLATNREEALKYLSSPMTGSYSVINEKLMIFELKKRKIEINRPIAIGVTILELSKLIMYRYYYHVLKYAYGDRVKLLYTDTDSFVIELKSRDLLEDLKCIKKTLDTSNFQPSGHHLSELYSCENASDLFYFKSEVGTDRILGFIGIRAKVYSLIRCGSSEEKILEIISKLKGVNKSSVEKIGMHRYNYIYDYNFDFRIL